MKCSLLTSLVAILAAASNSLAQDGEMFRGPVEIGEPSQFSVLAEAGTPRVDLIQSPGSSFISVHFSQFDLPEGDSVVVRSPDNSVSYTYTNLGRGDLGLEGGFHSTAIPGDAAFVEYIVGAGNSAPDASKGYVIDQFLKSIDNNIESVCGKDDSLPAKCYKDGAIEPKAYAKARAVLRLTLEEGLCTGWLVGSEGHFITNNHCVPSATDAKKIDIEAMAESNSCDEQCKVQLGCRGKVIATTANFIATNVDLDYTILKLPTGTDISSYGYLTVRASGPRAQEEIYIPQHPSGFAKRIASVDDGGIKSHLTTLTASNSCGADQVGYKTDTAPGASGSPVLSAVDNTVIALHHCGGCDNTGINSAKLVKDWKKKGITMKNAVV